MAGTTNASSGLISAAQQYGVNMDGIAAPAPAPTIGDGYKFVNYNGQNVLGMTSNEQDNLASGAQMYNAATGQNLSAQDYDKMINPGTYQARWGDTQVTTPTINYDPALGTNQLVNPSTFTSSPAPAPGAAAAPPPGVQHGGGVIGGNMAGRGAGGGHMGGGGGNTGASSGSGGSYTAPPGSWLPAAQGSAPGSITQPTATTASSATAPTLGSIEQVNAGSYNPATATATGYDASTYDPQGYKASTYNGAGDQAHVTNWNVAPNQTVQGQIANITDADSPLMQRAKAQGLISANANGLLNSSMAVGAAQDSVLQAAEPIAAQDAAMYGRAGSQNATEANTSARFNADQSGQTGRFNAGEENSAKQFTAQAGNQAGQFNSGEQNLAKRFTAGEQNTTSQFNATQKNQAGQFNTDIAFKALLANQDANLRGALTSYQGQLQTALANSDAANRLNLTNLDNQAKEAIVNLQGKWNEQIQGTASAGDAYRQMIATMGSIVTDKDMDATAKQAAIDQMTGMFDGYMQMEKSISGLDLGSILTFQQYANGGTDATTAAKRRKRVPISTAPSPAPATDNPGGGDGAAGGAGDGGSSGGSAGGDGGGTAI